jgi:23S rRNA maturation-related 3'-5' exoribonuclease YhaM
MNSVYEALEGEVALIQKTERREAISAFLKTLPAWLLERGATSSKKYHSGRDNGPGGLIYHTRAVVRVLTTILEEFPMYDYPESRDNLIAAAIVHDLAKYDTEGSRRFPTKNRRFTYPKSPAISPF